VHHAGEEEQVPEPSGLSAFRSPSILGFEPISEREEEPEEFIDETEPEPESHIPEPFIIPEPEPEPVPSPMPEPEPVRPPVPEPEPPGHHHPEIHETKPQRTTFDLFSEGSHGTLADRYRESQEKRVADKLSENKIADLRTTIGINDKFLFINELFDGNMRIYDEAVSKLNDCPTMAQADLLLLDLKIVYNWDSESPTVRKFVDLVRRKF
jgi:hypothetical protein